MFIEVIYASAIWTITILVASVVTGLLGRRLSFYHLPFVFQITLLSVSLLFIFALNVRVPIFNPSPLSLIGLAVIPVSYLANAYALKYDYELPFIPKGKVARALLLLILAPLAEELNFRGLYECLIRDQALSILLPSVTFGLIHYAPYRQAPEGLRKVEVVAALALGFVLSIVLKVGGLLLSVMFHSLANAVALSAGSK